MKTAAAFCILSLLAAVSFGILSVGEAWSDEELKPYTATIEVKRFKRNGRFWDPQGGAPDPFIIINGQSYRSKSCEDSHLCTVTFHSIVSGRWRVIIYDRDFFENHDLIGKGTMEIGENTIGRATVRVVAEEP